jgi:hypothetical protein
VAIAINDQAVWRLHGNVAELNFEKLSGRIDVSRPNLGLGVINAGGAQQTAELLRVYRSDSLDEKSWPLAVAEFYVRGNDLVSSYQATEDWPFSPQLYWRANSLSAVDGVLASASLLVSVQTHLLDTVPQIAVASSVPCEELLFVLVKADELPRAVRVDTSQTAPSSNEDDCCVVSRLRDVPVSYVEVMPAGDFHAFNLRQEENRASFEWRLFAEFLEKGVIRRARIHSAFVPRQHDIEIAAACCKAINGLELPLTT